MTGGDRMNGGWRASLLAGKEDRLLAGQSTNGMAPGQRESRQRDPALP